MIFAFLSPLVDGIVMAQTLARRHAIGLRLPSSYIGGPALSSVNDM